MNEPIETTTSKIPDRRNRKARYLLVAVVALLILIWVFLRPGVFTVPPIEAFPEGVTIIYHSRNPEMPFFSSPDSLCLQSIDSIMFLCRAERIAGDKVISDRIILRLPYNHWAYLQSTDGHEFGR